MNECSNILQGTYSNITLENIQTSSSTLNVPLRLSITRLPFHNLKFVFHIFKDNFIKLNRIILK